MIFFRVSLKALAVTFAVAVVAGAVLLLARPHPISNTVLGATWECTRDRLHPDELRAARAAGDPGGRNLAQGGGEADQGLSGM